MKKPTSLQHSILKGPQKNYFMLGSILLLIQNFLYYFYVYTLPFDIIGAFLISFAFLKNYTQLKEKKYLVISLSLFSWALGTLIWRILMYQTPTLLEDLLISMTGVQNYDSNEFLPIFIIFGACSILFFIGIFFYIKKIVLLENFVDSFNQNKGLAKYFPSISLIYLILHVIFSLGIVVGSFLSSLKIFVAVGIILKLFLVPAFGIFTFGAIIYFLRQQRLKPDV